MLSIFVYPALISRRLTHGRFNNRCRRLLLYHVADNVDGGGQRSLRSDVLPSATVGSGSNTIGIDVVHRRVILRDDAFFVERSTVLETIPRSNLGHFDMPFDVHRRVHLRLSIQWFEFRTASRPLAVLRCDEFGSVLAARMNIACMKPVCRAWRRETDGQAVRCEDQVFPTPFGSHLPLSFSNKVIIDPQVGSLVHFTSLYRLSIVSCFSCPSSSKMYANRCRCNPRRT